MTVDNRKFYAYPLYKCFKTTFACYGFPEAENFLFW